MLLINCIHSRQETKERIKTELDQNILITADDKIALIKLTTGSCVCLYSSLRLLSLLNETLKRRREFFSFDAFPSLLQLQNSLVVLPCHLLY